MTPIDSILALLVISAAALTIGLEIYDAISDAYFWHQLNKQQQTTTKHGTQK